MVRVGGSHKIGSNSIISDIFYDWSTKLSNIFRKAVESEYIENGLSINQIYQDGAKIFIRLRILIFIKVLRIFSLGTYIDFNLFKNLDNL